MHRKRGEDFEKVSSLVLRSEEEGWLSLARSGLVVGATRVGGADGKDNIERVCLSPYVEKPFNSKVIKSFVPELRSWKYFSCFGIPMFYVYMVWPFYVHFTYSCMAMLHSEGASSQLKMKNMRPTKACTIDMLPIISKSNLSVKIKSKFTQAVVMSIPQIDAPLGRWLSV